MEISLHWESTLKLFKLDAKQAMTKILLKRAVRNTSC